MTRLPLLLALLATGTAAAATYTVDTSSDDSLSACTPAPQDCSLRGAIAAANASAGESDLIQFDLPPEDAGFQPDSGHWRIASATALPLITSPLSIDGFTQVGAMPSAHAPFQPIAHQLRVELRGTGPDGSACLQGAAALTVRGLVLNHCREAIFLFEPGPHGIEGNYLGTDVSGEQAVPNRAGVSVAGEVRIGGDQPGQSNLFAANRSGALVQFRAVSRLVVQGNVFGSDATLDAIPGRQDYGLSLSNDFAEALVGGSAAAEGNLFLGHGFNAIYAFGPSASQAGPPLLRIVGNVFGVGAGGLALGNGSGPGASSPPQPTVALSRLGYCRIAVGGDAPGEGNLFAHDAGPAIAVSNCWNLPLLGNAFLDPRNLAIDLATSNAFDGPTPNDPGDLDGDGSPLLTSAGNRLQNTAVVENMTIDATAGELHLDLRVDTAASAASYPLRIDALGRDAAGMLVPAATLSYAEDDAQQIRRFVLPLAPFERGLGLIVTDAAGNSSELALLGPLFRDGFESVAADAASAPWPPLARQATLSRDEQPSPP